MAYKKYIERGGKVYGPYIYHSKRVDGKVVSQYRGIKKGLDFNLDSKHLKSLGIVLGIFFLIGFSYIIYNGEWGVTGDSILTGDIILDSEIEKIQTIETTKNLINENLDTIQVNKISGGSSALKLTFQEREILENEIGDLSLEISQVVLRNGFLSIKYELGDYWIEFNYEEGIDEKTLSEFMEIDRIKWLKDLSRRVSKDSSQPIKIINRQSFGF